jgi:AcrR family transcriptional regulator
MQRARPQLRRDTQETRDRLLDEVGVLLAEQGPTFTMPDLARRAGVATATVYRHFDAVHDAHHEFYVRLINELVASLAAVSTRLKGRARFDAVCRTWVSLAADWGLAATHIRSYEGFLVRVRRGDPPTSTLYRALEPVLQELIDIDELPDQEIEYAVLVWITVFDERVIIDLATALGWSTRRIARRLATTVIQALGGGA